MVQIYFASMRVAVGNLRALTMTETRLVVKPKQVIVAEGYIPAEQRVLVPVVVALECLHSHAMAVPILRGLVYGAITDLFKAMVQAVVGKRRLRQFAKQIMAL
jgi:hypothetical protein